MSRCLSERSIDHVVLERAEIANSWRTGRWDSLRLLTPNWQSRLPGYSYQGDEAGGFMTMPEVVDYLSTYAATIGAPVEEHSEVSSVRRGADGFVVTTSAGEWRARSVVVASGPYHAVEVPGFEGAVPPGVTSITPADYRNPDQLDDGGVLVVGAAATGVQLADEIQRSGRPVTLAVGGHVRVPRVYRGMDIMWWLDAAGVLDERYDQVDDIVRARNVSSFQLVGSPAARPSTSITFRTSVYGLSAVSEGLPTTVRHSSLDHSRISVRSQISSWAGCSTASTHGRSPATSTMTLRRPPGRPPPGCPRYRPCCCRSVRARSRRSSGRPGTVPNTRG